MRILIADDHEVVREGLRTLLQALDDIDVVGEAGSVQGIIETAKQKRPDLVIMDVRLSDGSGVEACKAIREIDPSTKVIMLTAFPDEHAVLGSIVAGASGYLLKQARSKDLVESIRRVGRGESLLDPAITQAVFERIRSGANQNEMLNDTPTDRDIAILKLIADGMTNKQIANTLFLSEKTVKNYVSGILFKLNLSRRAEAAAYFVRHYGAQDL